MLVVEKNSYEYTFQEQSKREFILHFIIKMNLSLAGNTYDILKFNGIIG